MAAVKKEKQTNEKILDAFFDVYFRSPKSAEFIACGGNMHIVMYKYRSWERFLKRNNYSVQNRANTYEVVNVKKGRILMTGGLEDIAEELGISYATARRIYVNKIIYKDAYKIVLKPFDPELVRKAVEENG